MNLLSTQLEHLQNSLITKELNEEKEVYDWILSDSRTLPCKSQYLKTKNYVDISPVAKELSWSGNNLLSCYR